MPSVVELPDDVEALKKLVAELQAHAEAQRERIAILEHNIAVLTKIAFEAHRPRQPSANFSAGLHQGQLLFPELIEAAERVADRTGESGTVEVKKTASTRKGHGRRKQFPAHLPVIRTTYEPSAEERICPCGAELTRIGEDVTRELERLEICVVHEIARAKYACKACEETVRTAQGPERVIDKGLLGVGFLAHVIVERFLHHLPYHRLEKKYFSEGLDLSRVVLCESALRCAELLEPVYRELTKAVLASRVIPTDDTSVHVAERSDGEHKDARVWIYLGEGGEHVYDYTESRNRDGPRRMLGGYTGYIQADAYKGYDAFFGPELATEVACWAHCRRYFEKAEATDPALAREALARIKELYEIERAAKEEGLGEAALRERRQKEARLRLESLCDWLSVTRTQVLDKSPLATAIDYALRQWKALTRYTEQGYLAIDNNAAERALRAVAVGRGNWNHIGNARGGRAAAILYSLVMSARAVGLDPRSYLRDVLLRIAHETDVAKLTPRGWKEHFQAQVQAHHNSILERIVNALA
jgi:transposase